MINIREIWNKVKQESSMADGWRKALVIENKVVSRGSYWIKLKAVDNYSISYEPGNVLSLGLSNQFGEIVSHPYTVSKADIGKGIFEHLYRLIPEGKFTPVLARIRPGQIINFRGIYHNPIAAEITPDAEAIIGIATGTGIGPLYGFAEKILSENNQAIPITLYVGYRYPEDVSLKAELDHLAEKYSHFKWHITYSNPVENWNGLTGRVTESIPPLLKNIENTHFHLVGNGNMIGEFRAALQKAGVLGERITVESYFNHRGKANPDPLTVEEIVHRFTL
jgi:NAD(P)H-flavin reductase